MSKQARRRPARPRSKERPIAALVVQHQAQLFARDAHFDHLPQIPRL